MGLRRYAELLRIPGVAPLMLAAFVGRLPYGMNILALILLLRAAGFDYAEVGIVTAASGLSVGAAAPVMGRVIDRVGQTRVLLFAAAYTAVSGTVFVVAVLEGASATLVTVLAFVAGLCVPPVSPSLRALLPGLVGRERLDTAFALDALLLELVFISGPLLAAGIATAISPEVAFLTGVALQAAGGLGVAASRYSRRWRPEPHEPGTRRASALGTPGIRVTTPAGCSRSGASGHSPAGSGTAPASGACARTCASSSSPVCSPPASRRCRSRLDAGVRRPRDRRRAGPRALDRGRLLADRRPRSAARPAVSRLRFSPLITAEAPNAISRPPGLSSSYPTVESVVQDGLRRCAFCRVRRGWRLGQTSGSSRSASASVT